MGKVIKFPPEKEDVARAAHQLWEKAIGTLERMEGFEGEPVGRDDARFFFNSVAAFDLSALLQECAERPDDNDAQQIVSMILENIAVVQPVIRVKDDGREGEN